MTSTRRIIFGVVGSLLMAIGLIKAAESFDPVSFGGRQPNADEDVGDPAVFGLS